MSPARIPGAMHPAGLLVALCTVIITGIVVRRELVPTVQPPIDGRARVPVRVDNWPELVRGGHRLGSAEAPLTVVVFSDFECPACALFANTVFPKLTERYGDKVALVYRHWPLPGHRLSYPAARASECANDQGSFAEFYHLVYRKQAELGLKTFTQFAVESGVADVGVFDRCMADTAAVPAIDSDVAMVRDLNGYGTPTVVINGWLVPGGANWERVDSVARSLVGSGT